MANGDNTSKEPNPIRDWLAIGISIFSIFGIAAISVAIIRTDNVADKMMTVFTSVLALAGSWVGTVLAFYFSKENFESASRSVTALVKQITPQEKLQSIPVKGKMTPKEKMFFVTIPADKIKLIETLNNLEKSKKGSRIPVLNDKDFPVYMVHKSTIVGYLFDKTQTVTSPPLDPATLTLQNLLDHNSQLKALLENSFAIIKEDSTLSDAKNAMESKPNCQDVFVTKNGTGNEPVIGWITNLDIAENANL